MSKDFKLANSCDHKINWEAVALSSDRRTISTKYPFASKASVYLRINSVLQEESDYTVVSSQSVTSIGTVTYIYLSRKCRLYIPLIEVQYNTYSNYCPKCLNTKYIDDVTYNSDGDMNMVGSEYLLVQNVEKRIITKLDSNTFHPEVGTDIHKIIGSKIIDMELLKSNIVDQINVTLQKLKEEQQSLVSSGRAVSSGELLDQIYGVDVKGTDDPTTILVIVTFTARSGKTLEYSQYVELNRQRVSFA